MIAQFGTYFCPLLTAPVWRNAVDQTLGLMCAVLLTHAVMPLFDFAVMFHVRYWKWVLRQGGTSELVQNTSIFCRFLSHIMQKWFSSCSDVKFVHKVAQLILYLKPEPKAILLTSVPPECRLEHSQPTLPVTCALVDWGAEWVLMPTLCQDAPSRKLAVWAGYSQSTQQHTAGASLENWTWGIRLWQEQAWQCRHGVWKLMDEGSWLPSYKLHFGTQTQS